MALHVTPAREVSVGPDRVRLEDDRVVIDAVTPMDWPVREFKRVPIFFETRKFYLRSKSPAEPPFAMRYELCPWPEEDHSASLSFIAYDADYVAERDAVAKNGKRTDLLHYVLLPFYPLLGLCWSGLKRRIAMAAGYEPSSLTKASVVLVFNLWIAEGIFVGWLRGGLVTAFLSNGRLLWLDWLLLGLVSADLVIRYNGLLRSETDYHLGFCEWVWPRKAGP